MATRVKKLKHLKSKFRNCTKWSSKFEILSRHVSLHTILPSLKSDEIVPSSLSPSQDRVVNILINLLQPVSK